MENRFFSLIIVPDSGNEIKSGSFNFRFVFYLIGFLVTTFFLGLFFIIGYHIKLSQEKDYKKAVSTMHKLLTNVEESKKNLNTFEEKLSKIQYNDMSFRQFAYMNVLDNDMYKAGIGGHEIINESIFDTIHMDYKDALIDIVIKAKRLDSRINIQNKSLTEIYSQIQLYRKEINSTPSMLPTHSFRITSDYRWRNNPITRIREFHDAVDLAGKIGDPVYATADGTVIFAKRQGALGMSVRIAHGYGYKTLYGHLNKILVKKDQVIKKHDIIGTMGSSGRSTGVHVHYAVTLLGKKVNPKTYF
ncbi:MAG TPA: M23 family metallopeptidase [bacterium]|nr:M23 family metallopeptidase [bacterium]